MKTIKEALNEGYTLCGRPSQEWQILMPIETLTYTDFDMGTVCLAEKQPNFYSFNKASIAELLAETIAVNEGEDSGRDNEEVYEAIKALDFSQTEKIINEALKKYPYYMLTDIELTP